MDELQTLWKAHLAAGFPRLSVAQVNAIDLAELDGAVAGCVSTFLDGNGQLDSQRVEVLERCRRDLLLVTLNFHRADREYFLRLYTMTCMVLDRLPGSEA